MMGADFRASVRSLLRRPLSTVFAVVVLGLGIGSTTTLFAIVDGVLLSGLPFAGSDRLVALFRTTASIPHPHKAANLHDFADWRQKQHSFEHLAAYQASFAFLSTGSGTEGYVAAYVTPGLFDVLRVRPSLGRGFAPEEERAGASLPVIVSHDLWQRRFGSDPGILGRQVRVNRAVATVVGVMPEGFGFPYRQDLWMPLQMDPDSFSRDRSPLVFVLGRLNPGVPLDAAQAEMKRISAGLAEGYPATNRDVEATVEPFAEAFTDEQLRSSLWMMLAGVFGILLIACASVANLLLARTVRRRGELALRAALGASRRRLFLQLLLETLLLAAAATILALVLAGLGVDLFKRFTETGDYLRAFWISVELDAPALGFALVLAGFSTLATGLAPAVIAVGRRAPQAISDVSRGSTQRPPRELVLEGRPAEGDTPPTALPVVASPSFFDTFGIRLATGRGLPSGDRRDGGPTAVVSRSFARLYL